MMMNRALSRIVKKKKPNETRRGDGEGRDASLARSRLRLVFDRLVTLADALRTGGCSREARPSGVFGLARSRRGRRRDAAAAAPPRVSCRVQLAPRRLRLRLGDEHGGAPSRRPHRRRRRPGVRSLRERVPPDVRLRPSSREAQTLHRGPHRRRDHARGHRGCVSNRRELRLERSNLVHRGAKLRGRHRLFAKSRQLRPAPRARTSPARFRRVTASPPERLVVSHERGVRRHGVDPRGIRRRVRRFAVRPPRLFGVGFVEGPLRERVRRAKLHFCRLRLFSRRAQFRQKHRAFARPRVFVLRRGPRGRLERAKGSSRLLRLERVATRLRRDPPPGPAASASNRGTTPLVRSRDVLGLGVSVPGLAAFDASASTASSSSSRSSRRSSYLAMTRCTMAAAPTTTDPSSSSKQYPRSSDADISSSMASRSKPSTTRADAESAPGEAFLDVRWRRLAVLLGVVAAKSVRSAAPGADSAAAAAAASSSEDVVPPRRRLTWRPPPPSPPLPAAPPPRRRRFARLRDAPRPTPRPIPSSSSACTSPCFSRPRDIPRREVRGVRVRGAGHLVAPGRGVRVRGGVGEVFLERLGVFSRDVGVLAAAARSDLGFFISSAVASILSSSTALERLGARRGAHRRAPPRI